MDAISGLLAALGLSTAAGLNAYVPLLVVGIVSRYTDLLSLQGPYAILENPFVLLAIAIIALLDFVGDKIPAVDSGLHAVGAFISPVAGAVLALAANSAGGSVSPVLAAVCGIVLALTTHGARTAVRPVATATTGGVANPVVSLVEDSASLGLSLTAIFLPAVAVVIVVLFLILFVALFRRITRRRDTIRRR